MARNLEAYQVEIVERLIIEAGLPVHELAWRRYDGSSSGFIPIASDTLEYAPPRPNGLSAGFSIVRAPDRWPKRLVRFEGQEPGWEAGGDQDEEYLNDRLGYHVWGHVSSEWLLPGSRTEPISWPEAIAKLRLWLGQLAAHLGNVGRPSTGANAGPVITIHGNVGALQTGAGASAVNYLAEPNREAFVRLMQEVLELVERNAQSVPPDPTSAALRETIVQAVVEAQKERPNPVTLRGLALGVATGVQALGSMPQAYLLLKAAGAHIGIQLP